MTKSLILGIGSFLVGSGILVGSYVIFKENQFPKEAQFTVISPEKVEEKLLEGEELLKQTNKLSIEKALMIFNELASKNVSPEVRFRIKFGQAVALEKNKDRLVALEIYKDLNQTKDLEKNGREKVGYHLGNLLLRLNQEEEGRAHLEEVLRTSENRKLRSLSLISIADFYYKRKEFDKAKKNYILSVHEDPNNIHARIGWTRALRAQGKDLNSLDLFDDYIEEPQMELPSIPSKQLVPGDVSNLFQKGKHFFDRKKYTKAIQYFSKNLDNKLSTSEREKTYYYLAEAHFFIGENSKSKSYIQKVLLNPDSSYDQASLYRKGTILFKEKKYADAAAAFNDVVDKYPISNFTNRAKSWKNESLSLLKENQKYNSQDNIESRDSFDEYSEDE
jgi:tetratricopeptide (TPR) repeat protein